MDEQLRLGDRGTFSEEGIAYVEAQRQEDVLCEKKKKKAKDRTQICNTIRNYKSLNKA